MGEKISVQTPEKLDAEFTALCDRLGAADYVFAGGTDPNDGRILIGIQLSRDGFEPIDISALPIRDEDGAFFPGCSIITEDSLDFLDYEGNLETFAKIVDALAPISS